MPNFRCQKCNASILSCIESQKHKNEVVELIFSKVTLNFNIFHKIFPRIKHNEINNNTNCDGIFIYKIFEKTPFFFDNINYIYYLRNTRIKELKNILLNRDLFEKQHKIDYSFKNNNINIKPQGYKSINSSSLNNYSINDNNNTNYVKIKNNYFYKIFKNSIFYNLIIFIFIVSYSMINLLKNQLKA